MRRKINKAEWYPFPLLIIIIICTKPAVSQDSTNGSSRPVITSLSLMYNFPQSYGVSASVDYPFKSIVKKSILKNGDIFTKQKDRYWELQAAVYRYPYNYTGVLLVPAIGARRYVSKSIFYETSFGIGVLRTFYDGKVYQVDASGNVSTKSLFGRFYATSHLASSFNYLLQNSGGKIVALHFKPSLWFQYPFDSFIKPQVSLEVGIKYEFTKQITKTRIKIKHRGR